MAFRGGEKITGCWYKGPNGSGLESLSVDGRMIPREEWTQWVDLADDGTITLKMEGDKIAPLD